MPVHAHLNLIGWVGICLFGLYYRAHPASIGRLAWVQAGAVAIGCAAMLSSLATILLTGSKSAYAIAFAGTFAIWLGMALFVVIVVRDRLDAIAVNMLPNLSETASGAGRSPR